MNTYRIKLRLASLGTEFYSEDIIATTAESRSIWEVVDAVDATQVANGVYVVCVQRKDDYGEWVVV